jgi:UDP-3-O-[3-hydroxymyristoyl] glucosamine N-acyltransferase
LFIAVEANALNHARLELYGRARLRGFRMITLVHPTAYVSPAASLGDNVWLGPGAHVAAGCKVGSNTLIGVHSRLDLDAMVGTHVWIGAGCSIGSGSRIGNHCVLGTDVKLCAGTRLGKYSLLEQPGPWSGEISAGTFSVNNYAEPAKVVGRGYTHSVRA